MSIVKVRAALEIALNAMSPALATAWENRPFTPVIDTPYQRVHLLTADPDNPEMGNGYTEQGILQITLFYPDKVGPAATDARIELIRATFKRGNSFTNSGIVTTILNTPSRSPSYNDGEFYATPVKIRFYSHNY